MTLLTLDEAEAIVGDPADAWAGRCYEIARKLAPHVGGEAVYGHWLGPIAPGTLFAPRALLGWVAHGWIIMPNLTVVDPTRWAFEGVEPYLFAGSLDLDEYDRGGNRLRVSHLEGPPAWTEDEDQFDLLEGVSEEATVQVWTLLDDHEPPYSLAQVHWLAHLPPDYFGGHVTEIFRAVQRVGMGAAIPWDNQQEAGVLDG